MVAKEIELDLIQMEWKWAVSIGPQLERFK